MPCEVKLEPNDSSVSNNSNRAEMQVTDNQILSNSIATSNGKS